MASRTLVPQQPRGAVVNGIGKQKNAGVDRKKRRALGDIGNVVVTNQGVEGKPLQQQLNRPVTRSFCAQLLANAQAAGENKKLAAVVVDGVLVLDEPQAQRGRAAKANNVQAAGEKKKLDAVVIDGVLVLDEHRAQGGRAEKAAPLKVAVKPVPDTVIESSSGTEEENKLQNPVNLRKSKEVEGSLKKKAQTLTAVLTARSKAACGLPNKSKDPIYDIDAADGHDQLAVVEYIEDIYQFYKLNESQFPDYMGSQPDINNRMREILVDWLIEVHHKFELRPETLYLTLYIVDQFLSMESVIRRELQLVGIVSMLIASKYEEIWAPEVNDFICISDKAYTREQVLVMEKKILGRLQWSLTVPTPYVFLVRFLKAAGSDQEMENLVFFLAELGMMRYATILHCPSLIAASVVYVARCTLKKTPLWTERLEVHTGYTEAQLMDCAKLLVGFHLVAAESKLKVVYRKYSNPQRGSVALLPPAKFLLNPQQGAC
ncbi:G2/mitotic-specific cyclin S13-7-like [Macadamia integrifolia]|uniref:G2/mitotic-specific cyclin S13-7-like n=1 Tax=Macadamia integrifolia TaxID=60698 RepID=UPI001C52DCCA|nr:G2/mitotic-specific cyclin S13-7-like [Macadamia integrifolia]